MFLNTLIRNKRIKSINQIKALFAVGVTLSLAACSSLSGLGGSSNLSCPLDAGGTCQSIRQTYEQVAAGQTGAAYVGGPVYAAQRGGAAMGGVSADLAGKAKDQLFVWDTRRGASSGRDVPSSGQPLRTESDVLRVWVAPYEDDEGVLRDQAHAYVVLENARWSIEHNQRRIMQAYAPVKPPSNMAKPEAELPTSIQSVLPNINPSSLNQ
jgi:conjugal transfer pilus assembly protein TraV